MKEEGVVRRTCVERDVKRKDVLKSRQHNVQSQHGDQLRLQNRRER